VFANIIVLAFGIQELEPCKSRRGHMFLILSPRNPLVLQQVNDSGDVCRYLGERIVLHPKVFSTDSGNIIGFRGMGHGEIIRQLKTLLCQCTEIRFYKETKSQLTIPRWLIEKGLTVRSS